MTIAATQAASNATDTAASASGSVPQQELGQQDFLKLLTIQLQQQDPMNPMEDTAFIAQMAQFSTLQQTTNLVQQMARLQAGQDVSTATGYIGREVTVLDSDGSLISGEVSEVELVDGIPRIVIGDYSYSLSAVLLVKPGVPSASGADAE